MAWMMKSRLIYLLLLLVSGFLLSTCSVQQNTTCNDGLELYQKITLYFGLSTPDGNIPEKEWVEFLDDIVTHNFPEGFTVFDTYGQWEAPGGDLYHEPGRVLIHFYRDNKNEQIQAVIEGFKQKFEAQSVIHEAEQVCISF